MDNSDTAEYRAFQSCFDRLVTGVGHDVESVARKAFTKNLISQENQRSATNRHHDETHRATKLLEQILTKIKQNPTFFDTFVAILDEIVSLNEVAKELTSERAKQTGFNLCRPGKPTASDVTEDTITLQWEKPEHVSERVKFYFVRYQSVESQIWMYEMMDSNDTKLTIIGLTPQAKYIFKVRPELEDGETGAWSENSDHIETKPPPCQPGKPTASAVTHDSITVEWSKPEHNSETVHLYCLSYRCVADESWMKVMTQSNRTIFTASNLSPQTKYIFKVRPELVDGDIGTWSHDSDPIKTKANPPGRPVATKVTHDSISLKWDPPQFNCKNISYYKISYSKFTSNNFSDQWTHEKSSTISTTISSLSYNAQYVFKVRPVRKNGELGCESPCSEPINTSRASPPGRPAATNVTHNSITLSWSKPRYGAENGTNYVVLQCKKSIPDTEKWREVNCSSLTTIVRIISLDPSRKYCFKVKLVCPTGESDESEVSDPVRTKSVCKPGKPYATKITQDSISLQWEIPEQNYETVEEYNIMCTKYETDSKTEIILTALAKPQFKTVESRTISGLSSGSGYKFTVVPSGDDIHCEYLESEISDVIVTTVTPPPGRPQLEDVTHDTAMVKWTHPHQGREKIFYYTVCYYLADNLASECKECNTSGLQTYKVVSELSRRTKYKFKVVPKCKDGMKGTESEVNDSIVTMATSPPGVPEPTEVTHKQISLKWTPPEIGGDNVSSYIVYHRQLEDKTWKWQNTRESNTHITIRELETNKLYQFKVRANCKPGCGDGGESNASEPVLTKCCLTGRPRATAVSHNSVQLVWDKPLYEYGNITSYEVHYKVGRSRASATWHETRTVGRQENIKINSLAPNTEYIFLVRPISGDTDVQTLFQVTDYVKTEDSVTTKPLAISMYREAHSKGLLLRKGPPAVYQLPGVTYTMRDEEKMIAKCHLGDPELGRGKRERVLMLVGATGDGKSTLIECMVNYILGVKWEYDFRFQLIQKEATSQVESQTKYITAYTFYPVEGSALDYTLTIIGTPGYGDIRGIEHDRALTEQIHQFFSTPPPHGIDHIDGVGFVTKAGSPRLTPTQRYIFDSILGVFGRDMERNIFLMVTFCDGQIPEVLEAIKAAEIPNVGYFKLNNSALYANNIDTTDTISSSCWDMGFKTLGKFFTEFEDMEPISLQLTRATLEERKQLENLVEGLHTQITHSLDLIRQLNQDEEAITAPSQILSDNVDSMEPFIYEIEVMKGFKQLLPDEKKATNCLKCNFTCHFPCTIEDDEKIYKCQAMGGILGFLKTTDVHCVKCPGKCHWSLHTNKPYKYVRKLVKEKRTLKDLIMRYSTLSSSEQQPATKDMLGGVAKQLKETCDKVLDLIKQTQESINKLDRIAFKKSDSTHETSSQVAYIEVLIEAEKKGGKEGCEQRIKALTLLRHRAQIVETLTRSHALS